MIMTFCKFVQARLPIYVLLLSGNNCLLRFSLVVRASDCQCTSCNGPGLDPSIRRHSGIWGAADEAVLNTVRKKFKIPPKKYLKKKKTIVCCTLQSAFLLNQSQVKMKSELLADLLALHKIRRKLMLLTLRKFKFT